MEMITIENANTEKKYIVGKSEILPTLFNGDLAIAYIKEIIEEEPKEDIFGGAIKGAKVAVMIYANDNINYGPTMLMDANFAMTDEEALAEIERLTEGMKETNKEKVISTIMRSKGIVANAEDAFDTKQYFEEADKQQIKEIYEKMTAQLDELRKVPEIGKSRIEHYMFRKHILLQGPKGVGKTYQVDKLLKDKGIETEFLGGNESIEAIDLQGFQMRNEDGNLIWKDGAVTAAFRKASMGQKTVLFIDEMLRIPKRELNFLVSCLTPDSENMYVLRTGRVSHVLRVVGADGKEHDIAQEEIIRVKSDMLWAVGTTNAGAGYAVDTIDEALADRFRTIIISAEDKKIKDIVLNKIKEKGFKEKYADKLMSFYKAFNGLREAGELTKTVNVRHLVEVIDLADEEDHIALMLKDLIPTFAEMSVNGTPNETQESIIEELIDRNID
jgi:hypothetical protein